MTGKQALPTGWEQGVIGDLVGSEGEFTDGDWVESKDQDPYGEVRLIQLADVGDGRFLNKSARFLTGAKAKALNCTFLRAGDVLVARMPEPLGRAAIFPGDEKRSVTAVDVCIVRPGTDEISNSWLVHAINSPQFRGDVAALQSGSTRKRISRGNLASVALRIPPTREQKRIADKCDELLSDLDGGIAALQRALERLKLYRAAVLKAAVEGRLTETWRAAHPDFEPAEKLLERILAERRKKWEEAQLKKYAEKGQSPPKDWKDRYPEPSKPDLALLPALRKGWCWATIDQCALGDSNAITDGPFGSNLKSEHYAHNGPRVIRLQNIGDGEFVDASAHISQERYTSLQKHAVSGRDVVIAMLGEVLPRACVIPDHVPPAIVKADCAKVSFNKALCVPEYANCALNSEMVRKRAASSIKGVGRPRLNLSHVREIPIPLPPLMEQLEIWAAVSTAIDASRHQGREVATSIARSAGLRQAILKRAFKGMLVPQDPKDEPASRLLERIRAQRAVEKGRTNGGGGSRKKGRRRGGATPL